MPAGEDEEFWVTAIVAGLSGGDDAPQEGDELGVVGETAVVRRWVMFWRLFTKGEIKPLILKQNQKLT